MSRDHFDRWAASYDLEVPDTEDFPFTGYRDVLATVLARADVRPGATVLDLGTGTGNLASLFASAGCRVWGTDFSPEMIARARAKNPDLELAVCDLREPLPDEFPRRFDRIVSAYALHHLDLPAKTALLRELVVDRLADDGVVLVADVAFATRREHDETRARVGGQWDASEHYWIADEVARELAEDPFDVSYRSGSDCAGVFELRSSSPAPRGPG